MREFVNPRRRIIPKAFVNKGDEPQSTEEEIRSIVETMVKFMKRSKRIRKEIERLPIHFMDAVIHAAIEPFLKERGHHHSKE
jgi:hypothetical protein